MLPQEEKINSTVTLFCKLQCYNRAIEILYNKSGRNERNLSYQSAYRSAYRPYRRRRRRRRNSHYGVLIALILVVVIAVPVAFHIVKGISGAIFGGDQNQLVYQVDNTRAWQDGKAVDLGAAAPYRNTSGVVYVSMSSLCDNLGMELTWDEASKTASTQFKQDKISIQAGSTTLRFNEENKTMAAAPEVKDGVVFAPVRDICEAFSWQVGELGADQGDLVVVSQSKKELDEKRLGKIAEKALKVLGPSEQQVTAGSISTYWVAEKRETMSPLRRLLMMVSSRYGMARFSSLMPGMPSSRSVTVSSPMKMDWPERAALRASTRYMFLKTSYSQ